jgi:hypothetical protein
MRFSLGCSFVTLALTRDVVTGCGDPNIILKIFSVMYFTNAPAHLLTVCEALSLMFLVKCALQALFHPWVNCGASCIVSSFVWLLALYPLCLSIVIAAMVMFDIGTILVTTYGLCLCDVAIWLRRCHCCHGLD